jgi:hypothetical protein
MEKLKNYLRSLRHISDKVFDILFYGILLYFLLNLQIVGNILLCVAAMSGYNVPIRTLIYFGANVHAYHDLPLASAVSDGHTEAVKTLLDHGAGANLDESPLVFMAAKGGHFDTAKFLLENGAIKCSSEDFWQRMANRTTNLEFASIIREELNHLSCQSEKKP